MTKQLLREYWWLMYCCFPDLMWARLRVYTDGSADVFDSDGRTLQFADEDDARLELESDEFRESNDMDEEDAQEAGVSLSQLVPPSAASDAELLPLMYCKYDEAHKPE